jgi:hypothetical protein
MLLCVKKNSINFVKVLNFDKVRQNLILETLNLKLFKPTL